MKFLLRILVFVFLLSSPSVGHEIETEYCSPGMYTDDVSDIRCTSKDIQFKSKGLPAENHQSMVGITATNQQMPRAHAFEFRISKKPVAAREKTIPDSGAIGVAVNGVPIFDPSTQGKVDPKTGKRPSTLAAGELDRCGGHAGRGDDYHYHVAPVCLIKELGAERVDKNKQPIGFAADGFPILALGWFDKRNNVEGQLDKCRGMMDSNGNYFYNVKNVSGWDVLDCFTGTPKGFAKDRWQPRLDVNGNEIVGRPVSFDIKEFVTMKDNKNECYKMSGVLKDEKILQSDGSVKSLKNEKGDIFYCNQNCYGMFFEADTAPKFKGRVMYYEKVWDQCPSLISSATVLPFKGYEGPRQSHKAPQSTSK